MASKIPGAAHSQHWRRTRSHCQHPPWPASWRNQASAGGYCPPTTGLSTGTSKPAMWSEQATRLKDAGRPAIIWRITPAGRGWLDELRQSTSPRRRRRRRSTARDRTGTARGRRTGPGTGRGPRRLRPSDPADQPQTRRSPATRSRLHPRPDRRGLPRQQREDPPGPPLGPGRARRRHAPPRQRRSRASPSPPKDTRSPANSASTARPSPPRTSAPATATASCSPASTWSSRPARSPASSA